MDRYPLNISLATQYLTRQKWTTNCYLYHQPSNSLSYETELIHKLVSLYQQPSNSMAYETELICKLESVDHQPSDSMTFRDITDSRTGDFSWERIYGGRQGTLMAAGWDPMRAIGGSPPLLSPRLWWLCLPLEPLLDLLWESLLDLFTKLTLLDLPLVGDPDLPRLG